jgi:hypothetical protein
MTDASPEPMTETTAFQELVKWSAERPAWQRDALRRLIQNCRGLPACRYEPYRCRISID